MKTKRRRPQQIALKPCPFCGEVATSLPWRGGAPTKVLIECISGVCEVGPSVTGETFAEAAMFWNRRVKA